MKQRSIVELNEGETFAGVLWLVSGSVRTTKRGDPYWEGNFSDSTGTIAAKLWDASQGEHGRVNSMKSILAPGGPLSVRAKVGAFNGVLQLDILSAEAVESGQYDPSTFSPSGSRSLTEMKAEMEEIIASMKDEDFIRLMESLKTCNDFFAAFSYAPAAKGIHHAWIGGLFEHSLSLARNVKALAPGYPLLNEDLLICACFFHDAGKAFEISADPGFEYTKKGKLLGHIYMGARLVEELTSGLQDFSEEKKLHLLHVVLSHQGERSDGYGSPVDPLTPEAVFFHQLDNLDAKVQNCLTKLEEADSKGEEGEFTNPRDNFLRKGFYRTRPDNSVDEVDDSTGEKPDRGDEPPGKNRPGLF